MSDLTALQRHKKAPTEVLKVRVSFLQLLYSGELLTGTPTVAVSPSGPTLSAAARNTASMTIMNEVCIADQAVAFDISGGTAGTGYTITVTAATTAGATRVRYLLLDVATE